MTDIPDEVARAVAQLAFAHLPQPPPIPDHIERSTDDTPHGVHVCQSGRADGAEWICTDDYWFCPFCQERGPGYDTEATA